MDFEGEFHSARDCQLVLRGPRPGGSRSTWPVAVRRCSGSFAKYADAWNWWSWDETTEEIAGRIAPINGQLDDACATEGRDPLTLSRTLDIFTVVPEGFDTDGMTVYHQPMQKPITGSSAEIADYVLRLGVLGFDEVRCDVYPQTTDAIEALAPVVDRVHAG